MTSHYLGIDPGLTGALALIDEDGKILKMSDMPTVKRKLKTRKRKTVKGKKVWVDNWENQIDEIALARKLRSMIPSRSCKVYLEECFAVTGSGAHGSFRFGAGWGIIRGILTAMGMEYQLVRSAEWIPFIKDGEYPGKEGSIELAIELFPGAKAFLSRKKDDGRAEALLIAEYGRRMVDEAE